MIVKIVCTSDWHGQLPTDLPDGDVLIIAGDICPVWDHNREYQARWIREEFSVHMASLPHNDIIVIAGNHDFVLEDSKKIRKELGALVHYLHDTSVEINGFNFHGSPWSTSFGDWALMKKDQQLEEEWVKIPEQTDVLVVHGPPHKAGDLCEYGGHAGSETLRRRILDLNATLVVTGHIHEAYGRYLVGRTTVANVSLMNLKYKPVNPAMVFDISKRNS